MQCLSEALCEGASEVVRLLAQRFLVDDKVLAIWANMKNDSFISQNPAIG